MINRTVDIAEIALTPEENRVLLEIRSAGVIPDTHWQEGPYSYFIRLNLIEHTYSDKFAYTLGRVEDLSTRTALTIENDIRPAIGKLADGHELLFQKIDDMARKDEVEDEMTLFRTVLAAHSRDIAQLKKAQRPNPQTSADLSKKHLPHLGEV